MINMDRRRFIQTGFSRRGNIRHHSGKMLLLGQVRTLPGGRRVPSLVTRAVTAPNPGFPSVAPLFSGIFLPENIAGPLVMSATPGTISKRRFKLRANAGYRVACFTTIQNFNRTFLLRRASTGNRQLAASAILR